MLVYAKQLGRKVTYNIFVEALFLFVRHFALRFARKLFLQRCLLRITFLLLNRQYLSRIRIVDAIAWVGSIFATGNDLVLSLPGHKLGHAGRVMAAKSARMRPK